MKTRIFLIVALFLFGCYFAIGRDAKTDGPHHMEGSIHVNASVDLYGLAIKWADEYQKLNPLVKIDINKVSEENIAEVVGSKNEIGFISGKLYSEMNHKSAWNMIVARNVIVPVMNDKNPLLGEISATGISEKEMIQIIRNPGNANWETPGGKSHQNPVHVYVVNDPSVLEVLKGMQNTDQLNMSGIQTMNTSEMIQSIQKDLYAIGFCNLAQVTNKEGNRLQTGLMLVPIDRNGNGKLDYMEDIYDNMQSFNRGVWIGKYPKALSSNIYTVSAIRPTEKLEVEFLKWVITDGQKFLGENGYSDLIYNEQIAQLAKLDEPAIYTSVPIERTNSMMSVLLLVLVIIVIGGVVVELAFVKFSRKVEISKNPLPKTMSFFNEDSIVVPKGLYFDKTHSWAFMRKNGGVKVGIDDFLQHITGKITRIEMRSAGDIIKKGDRLFSLVHKGKQVHIYSPVSGTIKEINKKLVANSSLLNSDPYSEGWVYIIEPINWALELQYLQVAENFKAGLKDEFRRLKDFFSIVLKSVSPDFSYAVMQDGGTLTDSPLAEFGPDVWDDFQTKFIDASK